MKKQLIRTSTGSAVALLLSVALVRAVPVEWTIASGGNGHFYEAFSAPAGISWTDANADAILRGGYLATVPSAAENAFVFALVDFGIYWTSIGTFAVGPWLGGFQPPASPEPGGNWQWLSGEPFTYTNWNPGEPNNSDGDSNALEYFTANYPTRGSTWNDINKDRTEPISYVVEYNTLPIPEPGTAVLLSFGALFCLQRRALRTNERNKAIKWSRE